MAGITRIVEVKCHNMGPHARLHDVSWGKISHLIHMSPEKLGFPPVGLLPKIKNIDFQQGLFTPVCVERPCS